MEVHSYIKRCKHKGKQDSVFVAFGRSTEILGEFERERLYFRPEYVEEGRVFIGPFIKEFYCIKRHGVLYCRSRGNEAGIYSP